MNIQALKVVGPTITLFYNRRQDEGLTKETQERHDLEEEAGNWSKRKLRSKWLKPISKHASEVRKWHTSLTLPWESGERILAVTAKPAYDAGVEVMTKKFNELRDELVANYNDAIDDARKMHNGTFDSDDYPPKAEFEKAFSIAWVFEPLPSSSEFVKVITGPALQELQARLEERNQRRIEQAVNDTWKRLLDPVMKLAERLAGKDTRYLENVVTDVREIVDLVPLLNVTNDPRLSELTTEVKGVLAGISSEALVENQTLRIQTAEKTISVLQRFAPGARKFA